MAQTQSEIETNSRRFMFWSALLGLAFLVWLYQEQIIYGVCAVLYYLWLLCDLPRLQHYAALRINLLAATGDHAAIVSWGDFITVLNLTGNILLLALLPLVIISCFTVYGHQSTRTKRIINIHTLPRIMARIAPAIIPALHYGDKKQQLLNVDPEEHRSAQDPGEFAQEHKLVVNRRLSREKAAQAFAAQLGRALTGNASQRFSQFNAWEKALFAAFGLQFFLDKRDEAVHLIDQLNISCLKVDRKEKNKLGYPALSLASAAFEKVTASEDARTWVMQHGWVRTAIAALHDNDLHLPGARFRWLKGLDRTLWYALSSTGRPFPFVEGAGVATMMHWEKLAVKHRAKLPGPVMVLAVDALEYDLMSIGAVIDDRPRTSGPTGPEGEDEDDDDDSFLDDEKPEAPVKPKKAWHPARRP